MPVYNAGRFLRECLDSILAQTRADFELIVCDDASCDDSAAILAEYAARDPRVRVLRNERNLGIARTRNRLLESLPDDCGYIALMDADDV
ncbi:MAG: glycosyltransferase family 2 protein, partial [Lentisphaeria bacterium]|nr:glycosyltransferase family 2 protein [Lentisphaeria bacterium]